MDPSVNQRDGAGEPLEFAKRRVQLSRELFERLQSRLLASGENYDTLTRNYSGGVSQLAQAFNIAAKYVGGVVYVRDQAGSSRAPFTPVNPALQRQALKFISDELFASNSFGLKADFVSRLSDNTLDRGSNPPVDRSPASALLSLQTQVIDRLMSARVADRLLNSRAKLQNPEQMLTLGEVYGTLTKAIWNDGLGLANVDTARRALQREHLRRLTAAILRPGSGSAQGDARALHRLTAKNLLTKATAAKAGTKISLENQAYLDEIIDTLKSALNAQMSRSVS
jgi:Met-zincin